MLDCSLIINSVRARRLWPSHVYIPARMDSITRPHGGLICNHAAQRQTADTQKILAEGSAVSSTRPGSSQAAGEHLPRIAQRFIPIRVPAFCIWGCGGEAPALHFPSFEFIEPYESAMHARSRRNACREMFER
jgi:hypothetical protein